MSERADVIAEQQRLCALAVSQVALGKWSLIPSVVVKPSAAPLEIPVEGLVVLRVLNYRSEVAEFGEGADKTVKACTLTTGVEAYLTDQAVASKEQALDDLQTAIGENFEADPSLSGLVDETMLNEADEETLGELGTDEVGGMLLIIVSQWNSTRSLG